MPTLLTNTYTIIPTNDLLLQHTSFTYYQSAAATGRRKSFALLSSGWHKVSIFGFHCCGWLPLHNISFSLIDLSSTGWTTRSCTHRLFVRLASSALATFTFACGLAHYPPFRCLFFLLCGEGGWVYSMLCCFCCEVCLDSLVFACGVLN